ncbi:uncharacterized protein TNCV_2347401 [Trichonephila clavipes]|nr:uncharacterized protein TNCV_2347401 [Trichonephila clavipes]
MAALVSEYTLEFFTLLDARGKKELIEREWCMKGLIASSYECPKCNEQMGLNERKSVVLDGFEWRCRKKGVNTHDDNGAILLPRNPLHRTLSSRCLCAIVCKSLKDSKSFHYPPPMDPLCPGQATRSRKERVT